VKVIVPPREGRAVKVLCGQRIRITTPKGAQAADFFAYNAENVGEWPPHLGDHILCPSARRR